MKDTAIILECKLDLEYLGSITNLTRKTKDVRSAFGDIKAIELESKGNKVLIFEEGGMNGKYSLPQTHLPLYAGLHLNEIKNVILLGFCGSLDQSYSVGSFVVPLDFINQTKHRERSFIDNIMPGQLFFYRMAQPYSPTLNRSLLSSAKALGIDGNEIRDYVVTEGPGFESSAEVRLYQMMGGSAVCFSGTPDVYFCRELDINFSCGFFVSNLAEGIENSKLDEILDTAEDQTRDITKLIIKLMELPIDQNTDKGYHNKYWMQKPDKEIYDLIK
jgi:purine nucleoside phosphorylase